MRQVKGWPIKNIYGEFLGEILYWPASWRWDSGEAPALINGILIYSANFKAYARGEWYTTYN